ncbi:hypothetical protein DFH09DRAFT_1082342 [Mycena vulgaris]|nr:hypothetical protein DFH09DRAFT_1082342 [Mycena vulgaris]
MHDGRDTEIMEVEFPIQQWLEGIVQCHPSFPALYSLPRGSPQAWILPNGLFGTRSCWTPFPQPSLSPGSLLPLARNSLKAYIDEIFEPAFVALGHYTEENTETWLIIDKFMRWISRNAQKSATTPPSTSATRNSSHREPIEPSSSRSALPPSSPILPTSSPIPQKDGAPWFFPSFNQFLSKIPEDDWFLTPGDTNLNESAHPYTNQHTGTNLSLLETIQAAYKLDLEVEAKLRAMEENCVLVNHLNTKPHRDHKNEARRTSHFRQALGRREARDELENIDDAIQNSPSSTRELREKKRNLQSLSGVKQTKRKGEKKKDKLPDQNELADQIDMDGFGGSSSPTRSGPAPLYLMDSDFKFDADIELDPSLEPLFPTPQFNGDSLEMDFIVGDLKDYLPYEYDGDHGYH